MAKVKAAAAINLIILSSYPILGLPNSCTMGDATYDAKATYGATPTHGASTSLFMASLHWPHRPEIASVKSFRRPTHQFGYARGQLALLLVVTNAPVAA
jgi:hypothetical protein